MRCADISVDVKGHSADVARTEKKKIDTLIRVGLKRILGIPQTTSTERLLELGLHNTVDELIEVHFAAQVARLSSTKAGLKILDEAGIAAPRVEISDGVQLTRDEREDIQVDPIPRNIHPVHHAGRRDARARAILQSVGSDAKAALFVDAAEYSTRRAFGVSVVDGIGQLVARASVCTDQVTVAEEIAIALALQAAEVPCVVYSDSRSAVWAFSGGLISQQAARLLRSGRRQVRWAGGHHISWFPAHVEGIDGVNPNASAHTLARECTNRAGGGEAIAPDFQEECPRCGLERCALTHMLWQCPANVGADFCDEDS
ncbi:hypothetical protein HPB50_026452 [Hyalomma asiaticum]|uniref:Uncharacterized protein n=1 Tax=Hyalomma asiaticum TaxID=266040 RepID=A0ACB7T1Y9_HYAAI|nr:hypothetical protein HPB50_026452 [Hyalomma asiaticum]